MTQIVVLFILAVSAFVGGIFLQIWLSQRKSQWAGLLLPVCAFLIGFYFFFYAVLPSAGVESDNIVAAFLIFLACNIPTAVYLSIYFACRYKMREDEELERINKKDNHKSK